ncbi:rhodanese-like domain-containing protein [Streptomyces sp. FXJ1.172]|uniref:rhodanese-like domain-containing protein n=1 Tax=Streptomyces sp. FXJ1.172 TaxID=710705 RepID=UPI0007D00245|nr:rhodanese-like domain-containing protein [Streptomyces sp. FXJ1.172]WEO99467.1 rhodanese-like domain-containing protein [Streptomyces sp. FXJ1.172]
MTSPHSPVAIGAEQARTRLREFTVIDVRTPGEFASGHLPGALNIPVDQLRRALPEIRHAAERGEVLLVCASGARSGNACGFLAEQGIPAATLTGGTAGWAGAGHELDRPVARGTKAGWSMEQQVRFTAGTLVLLGLVLGLLVHPAFEILSAGIAGGLVFSALTDTCGMAAVLGRLPHNRPRPADLAATLAALRAR